MLTTITATRAGLALILAATAIGVAGAQRIPPDTRRIGYCTGGLSTLTGSFARFHIALDDDSTEPGIFVVMRFIDQAGTVIRSKTANIAAGRSATLEYRGPSVLYRVQAEIFESRDLVNRSDRRTVELSQEAEAALFTAAGDAGFRLIGPGPIKVPCNYVQTQ